MPASATRRTPVYVNVYDMIPASTITSIGYYMGLGVFHSGVEILDKEFNFGGHEYNFTGVFCVEPRVGPPGVMYKETILVGFTTKTDQEINQVIQTLSKEYTGMNHHRNMREVASDTDSGKPTAGFLSRLRQGQDDDDDDEKEKARHLQEDHACQSIPDHDNPFSVREPTISVVSPSWTRYQAESHEHTRSSSQEPRFRSPDMDSPPASSWTTRIPPGNNLLTETIVQDMDLVCTPSTHDPIIFRYSDIIKSPADNDKDQPEVGTPPMTSESISLKKRKRKAPFAQDEDQDGNEDNEEEHPVDRFVFQRTPTTTGGERGEGGEGGRHHHRQLWQQQQKEYQQQLQHQQHQQQEQEHQHTLPSWELNTPDFKNIQLSSLATITPEGFSRLGRQPPRIPPVLPGPGQRVSPPERTFAATPTARFSKPPGANSSRHSSSNDQIDPEPLWASAGRRAVMRLKYGLYDEEAEGVQEDDERGVSILAEKFGEHEAASGSGSGSGPVYPVHIGRTFQSKLAVSKQDSLAAMLASERRQQDLDEQHQQEQQAENPRTHEKSNSGQGRKHPYREDGLGEKLDPIMDANGLLPMEEDLHGDPRLLDSSGREDAEQQATYSDAGFRYKKKAIDSFNESGRVDNQEVSQEAKDRMKLEAELEAELHNYTGNQFFVAMYVGGQMSADTLLQGNIRELSAVHCVEYAMRF
ncbi:hypothetical protein BGX28_008275 [Mortierella sp. GBA30]|nr:hypothetical protein BGX28_008275 [Mortierella sp. GBA30]